jgi:hypothetical protein
LSVNLGLTIDDLTRGHGRVAPSAWEYTFYRSSRRMVV